MRASTLNGARWGLSRARWLIVLLTFSCVLISPMLVEQNYAVAALILVLVATPVAYYQPIVLIAIPVLAAPLLGRTGDSQIGPLNAMAIVALWFLGLGALMTISRLKEVLQLRPFLVIVLLWALAGLSVGVSSTKGDSIAEVIRMASAIVMLPAAYLLAGDPARRRQIVLLLVCGSFIPLIIGFYQIVSGDVDYGPRATAFELESGIQRIYSTFYDVHPYAKYLMVLMPLALVMAMLERASPEAKAAWAIFFGALFANLIFTYSRSQLIGFLIAALVILYQLKKLNLRALLLGLPLVIAVFAVGGVFDRFADLAQPLDLHSDVRENSLKGRILIWKQGLANAVDRPILGHGTDTFQNDIGIQSHNVYLGLFYELGILGPLLYAWALISAAKIGQRCYHSETLGAFERKIALAVSSLSLAIIVVSGAENYVQATVMWWTYYALLGCMLAGATEAKCLEKTHI